MDLVINRYRSGVKTYKKNQFGGREWLFCAGKNCVYAMMTPESSHQIYYWLYATVPCHLQARRVVLLVQLLTLNFEAPHWKSNTVLQFLFFLPYATAKSHCWQCFPKQHPRRLCREESGASTSPCRSTCKGASMVRLNRKKTHLKVVICGSLCRSACPSGAVSLSFC